MGEAEIRQYLLYLVLERKIGPATQKVHVGGIKFLYAEALARPEVVARTPWPKVRQSLPPILSGTEVDVLLAPIESTKYRAIVMTAYGHGLRISEVCPRVCQERRALPGQGAAMSKRAAATSEKQETKRSETTIPDVFIEHMHAATKGSVASNRPSHVAVGGSFQKPPSNKGTVKSGSETVLINHKRAARDDDPAVTCNDPDDEAVGTVVATTSTVFVGR
jgi:uncharacterized Zn-binding protein involved in type VI secretion